MALTDLLPNSNDPLNLNAPRVSALRPVGPEPTAPVNMGDAPMPQLPTLRPLVTSPREQQIQSLTQKINAFENPGPSKPGFWHRLGQISARIGNIAGDVVAPHTMELIPGTQLNREMQHQQNLAERAGLQKQDLDEQNAASENALRGAQTAEIPARANLENAEADKDRAAVANGPDLATAYAHRVNQVLRENGDPSTDPTVMYLQHAITDIQRKPLPKGLEKVDLVGPDGKPMAANYDPAKGVYTDASGKVIPNPRPYEKPNQAGMVTVVAPDPNNPGGGIVERVGAGAHLAPGSMTASQYGVGAAADVKQDKARKQAAEEAQKDYKLMQTLAANPSPTNDLAMVMHYIGATKPDSIGKLRLNQNEIALVMGTRSSFGDLEAMEEKVRNGQKLTPEQRNNMLETMRILSASSGDTGGGPQMIRARDPQGVLHEAPAGTPLPAGWKAE